MKRKMKTKNIDRMDEFMSHWYESHNESDKPSIADVRDYFPKVNYLDQREIYSLICVYYYHYTSPHLDVI